MTTYLILHIFDVESNNSTFWQSFDGEVEPGSVLVFDVVDCDPDIVLNSGIWYTSVVYFLGVVEIAGIEVWVDGCGSKFEGFMWMWDRIIEIIHVINKINTIMSVWLIIKSWWLYQEITAIYCKIWSF